ncbi:hypothetical protein BSE24067_03238 [Burkholderia seminalis]|nr:hypothetical protein BSE24067_03238 [Burkholderia seminalis]
MFVVRGIVDAGREHGDGRVVGVAARRAHRGQRLAQHLRIGLDRAHLHLLEQLREELHHGLAVFQHVGHAGGRARIVLQHVELVLGGAHDVDADDVRVHVAGRPEVDHLRDERLVVRDQVLGHDARAHDFLAVVDVVEEGVQRHHALLDAEREAAPFGARDDARDDVERNQPLGGLRVAVDGERDARLAEHAFRVVGFLGEARGILRVEPLLQARVGRPYHVAGLQHFIEWLHRSFLHRSFSPALRMPDRRNECFARNVPCATPRYPPVFAPRRARPHGIAHHNGASPGAAGARMRRERARPMLRRVLQT